MHDVTVTFALKVGSEILREDDLPPPAEVGPLVDDGHLYGALVVEIDGEEVVNEDIWDRLDTVLESFVEAVSEVREGHESEVNFPDTRVEVLMAPADGEEGDAALEVERTRVYVDTAALEEALFACARRLLAYLSAAGAPLTPPLARLAEALEAREE